MSSLDPTSIIELHARPLAPGDRNAFICEVPLPRSETRSKSGQNGQNGQIDHLPIERAKAAP